MLSKAATVALLLVSAVSAYAPPIRTGRALRISRRARLSARRAEPEDSEPSQAQAPAPAKNPNDQLGLDFEFDGVTIGALLGAGIAFNFFVLGGDWM